jgi:hypothetical protein
LRAGGPQGLLEPRKGRLAAAERLNLELDEALANPAALEDGDLVEDDVCRRPSRVGYANALSFRAEHRDPVEVAAP